MTYEGWTNYATWNVVLWLSNEEPMYRASVDYFEAQAKRTMNGQHVDNRYLDLISYLGLNGESTMDGIQYDGDELDLVELDQWVADMVAEVIAYAK